MLSDNFFGVGTNVGGLMMESNTNGNITCQHITGQQALNSGGWGWLSGSHRGSWFFGPMQWRVATQHPTAK